MVNGYSTMVVVFQIHSACKLLISATGRDYVHVHQKLVSCRPHEALDEHDGLHYNKLASLRGQACHKDVNSDRLTGRQCVPARRAQAVPKRTLANITNTAKAADKKPKAPYGVKNNEGCTAARVPDLVTFWEQRASVQQH